MANWRSAADRTLTWRGMPRAGAPGEAWRDWTDRAVAANPIRAAGLAILVEAMLAVLGDLDRPAAMARLGVVLAAAGHEEADQAIGWEVTDLSDAEQLDALLAEYNSGAQSTFRWVGPVLVDLADAASDMLDQITGDVTAGPAEDTVAAWRRCLTAARDMISGIPDEPT